MSTPAALAAFDQYPQFILWKLVQRAGKPKPDKVPCSYHTGEAGDPHNPANWLTYDDAVAHGERLGCGVGYVFTAADPFFFIDLDDCLQPDGTWSNTANWFCQQFPGAALEVSQSGTGLHIFGRYTKCKSHRNKCPEVVELYTSLRFAALTCKGLSGDAGTDHTAALNGIIDTYLPKGADISAADWTTSPVPEWTGYLDDDELIAAAMRAQTTSSVFGNKASFADLWEADIDVLGETYPDSGGRPYDYSSADAALVAHLAFWTGKDCARIERIFSRSALTREKWTDRADYRQRTILNAIANCQQVYNRQPDTTAGVIAPTGTPAEIEARKTQHIMFCDDQEEYFKGCVYVRDMHMVFVPDGELLSPAQFKATYGGWDFSINYENKMEKNAFIAFTESRVHQWPKVHTVCFRPEEPPGSVITEAGRRMVNTYVPAVIPSVAGDVSRVIQLVEKLLPSENDRNILLAWMAACVQYPGVKFQWSPLIQGVEGNGKSLLLSCLVEAVGRKYTHFPRAEQISNNFNGWLRGKMLIGLEELKVGDKWELMEILKPLITNNFMEIESKGTNQVTTDNRANFFFCSNHRDAIIKAQNDRRYCIFYTAQQAAADLRRDGMDGDYFPNLYRWLRAGGYANVTHWLQNYPIPAHMNPATHSHRAPVTTSTTAALEVSLGPVEQEIMTAIEEERQGFRGGWLSSIALSRLIKELKLKRMVTPHKRLEIISNLGYGKHPALSNGKVPRDTLVDQGRTILYIKKESTMWSATFTPSQVLDMYEEAQRVG